MNPAQSHCHPPHRDCQRIGSAKYAAMRHGHFSSGIDPKGAQTVALLFSQCGPIDRGDPCKVAKWQRIKGHVSCAARYAAQMQVIRNSCPKGQVSAPGNAAALGTAPD